MDMAKTRFPAAEGANAVYGPEFAGSADVDGADADLIVSGCLYDVKTTVNPRDRLAATVRQLVGYVLLDWKDEYNLQHAGFYYSRQGRRMSWPLKNIIEEITGDPKATLGGLREDFREVARSSQCEATDVRTPRRLRS